MKPVNVCCILQLLPKQQVDTAQQYISLNKLSIPSPLRDARTCLGSSKEHLQEFAGSDTEIDIYMHMSPQESS